MIKIDQVILAFNIIITCNTCIAIHAFLSQPFVDHLAFDSSHNSKRLLADTLH